MQPEDTAPIFELTRGETVESIHAGAIAVVDSTGKLLAKYANPELVTFLRSSAKPFQALPLLEAGGQDHFADRQGFGFLCQRFSSGGFHEDHSL